MSTHHRRRTAIVVALALLAWLAVGCAGDAKGADDPVATDEVTMPKSYRFSPETIQVAAGTTVTFRNTDNFTHSVRLLDGDTSDRLVKPGESVQITFDQPGAFAYECSLHPRDMRGTVVVTNAPSGADTGGYP